MSAKIYNLPGANETLFVVIDFGNGDVKVMILGHFGNERYFPQLVRYLEGSYFDDLEYSYKSMPSDFEGSAVFRHERHDGGFVVGKHTEGYGGERMFGADKYIPKQLDPLLAAALLQVYPQSHDNVHLIVTHPQSATHEQLQALHGLLKGKHQITLPDGKKLAWRVKHIDLIPEARAALNTMMLAQTGKRLKKMPLETLQPGAKILLFDGGSWISAFCDGTITQDNRLQVNPNGSIPVHTGINKMFEVLSQELRSSKEIPQLKRTDSISTKMLNDALMHSNIKIRGQWLEGDAQKAVERANRIAVSALINPVQTTYHGKYNDGLDFDAMAISGGGGAGAGDYLMELFNHPSIAMVEPDIHMMRYGAIRGAGKAKIAQLGIDKVVSYVWGDVKADE